MSKEFCPYIHFGCRSTSSVWCFYWNCHRKTSCALCRVTETFFMDCFVSNGIDPTLCYTIGTKICEPYILVWPHALVHSSCTLLNPIYIMWNLNYAIKLVFSCTVWIMYMHVRCGKWHQNVGLNWTVIINELEQCSVPTGRTKQRTGLKGKFILI